MFGSVYCITFFKAFFLYPRANQFRKLSSKDSIAMIHTSKGGQKSGIQAEVADIKDDTAEHPG
jgi:hypothetical protein